MMLNKEEQNPSCEQQPTPHNKIKKTKNTDSNLDNYFSDESDCTDMTIINDIINNDLNNYKLLMRKRNNPPITEIKTIKKNDKIYVYCNHPKYNSPSIKCGIYYVRPLKNYSNIVRHKCVGYEIAKQITRTRNKVYNKCDVCNGKYMCMNDATKAQIDLYLKNNKSLQKKSLKRKSIYRAPNKRSKKRIKKRMCKNEFTKEYLQRISFDELLALAHNYKPNLNVNKNWWCRYCGAKYSSKYGPSPWGSYKLCTAHYVKWRQRKTLNLSKYIDEPINPINSKVNTDRNSLIYVIMKNQ